MKHVDNQDAIKHTIVTLEQQFPVDKWMVNNIHIWPYVRIILYMHLLTREKQNVSANASVKVSTNKSGLFRKLKLPFLLLKAALNEKVFFSKLKTKKILFFGSHIHRVKQNGLYFNRFYDAIVEEHKLENDVYMLEYQRVYNTNYNQQAVIKLTKNLNNYKLLLKLKSTKTEQENTVNLHQYEAFVLALKGLTINASALKITKQHLVKWVNKVESIQPFFKKFYKITQPEKVVFLGYYGLDDLYAALITANELGITTVDFQHGPQTNVHMAYAHWLKVPKNGFNTMPKAFWNWDKPSKNNIDAWAKHTTAVKSVLFGQPYINYWLKQAKQTQSEEQLIFYSMQTSPLDLFTKALITAIKHSKYKWVLRMHPRNKTTLLEFETFLKANTIWEKTEIQDAFTTPLPETLSRCALHVTNYSGCVIEARMMGIPTILVHNIGLEMFEAYLDHESVFYLNQKESNFLTQFEQLTEQLLKKNTTKQIVEMANPLS